MIHRVLAYIMNKALIVVFVTLFYYQLYQYGIISSIMNHFMGYKGLSEFHIIIAIQGILCLPYMGIIETGIIDHGIYVPLSEIIIPLLITGIYILIDTILCVILGRDLGKIVVGIKIYNSTGNRPNWFQFLLRNTIKYTSITFIPILLLYPLFNKSHKTLHDIITKTNVKQIN